jgi:rRNA maturation endonuclease Nob1
MTKNVCIWKEDEEYGMYETGCGNAFQTIEGDIEENNFKFCPYCGGSIRQEHP